MCLTAEFSWLIIYRPVSYLCVAEILSLRKAAMPKPDVSDERKPQILGAAAELFSERGIHASSMNEISKAANLSKAAVYHYYESKEAMVEALVRQLFDADRPELQKLVAADEPARKRLESHASGLVRLLEKNKVLYPVFAEFKAMASRDASVQKVLKPCFEAYIEAFTEIVSDGIRDGEFRKEVDAGQAAWALASIIEGAITMRHATARSLKRILIPSVELFL